MTMSTERYMKLLHQFSIIFDKHKCEGVLEVLKEEYKEKIDSIRVLETINNISALLKVLDNRGILKYNDISVLKHLSKWLPNDPITEKLLLDYNIWLEENSSQINNLYCCGKSLNSLNSYKTSQPKLYETAQLCHNLKESTYQKSEEQCIEQLLSPIESHVNIELQTVESVPIHNYWKRCKIKTYIRSSTIIFLLLTLFIGAICILVKIFYQSSALVPLADSRAENSTEQSTSKMPVSVLNVNIGNINEVNFAMNGNQYSTTNHLTTVPTIVREKELKDMVRKKLSRRVGRSWEDVCRRLKLEESVIEDIEKKFFNDSQGSEKMFNQALELYYAEHHPKWRIELMKALEDSRRRDLKEMVQEMIDQYN